MRNISSNALTKVTQATGTEPLTIVEVLWNDTTSIKYCDKRVPGIAGLILNLGSLDDVIRLDVGGNSAQLSVTLDDSDGHIKQIIDQFDIHKRTCIVYQWFDGLELGDAFELFRGEISSPIVWSEGARNLSFEIVSKVFSNEVGFAPEEGQFRYVPDNLLGKVWPLGFGTPIHVPATKAIDVKRATALSLGGIPDATLPLKRELLLYRIEQCRSAYVFYENMITKIREAEVSAYQLQLEYANIVVGLSNLRQIIADIKEETENINSAIEILMKQYDETAGASRQQIVNQISEHRAKRDKNITTLTGLHRSLNDMEYEEQDCKYRLNVIKFRVNITNKLRIHQRKLLDDNYKFVKELSVVNEFISRQTLLAQPTLTTLGSDVFDQEVPVPVNINGVNFNGRFVNGLLNIESIIPTSRAIPLGPRESTAPDTFWLTDSTLNLENQYIYTSKGYIAKVTSQEGNKCIIQLPRKNRNTRNTKRRIDYEDSNIFNDTLRRLLTGTETDAEIAAIATTIPREINPTIWNVLTGGNATFDIRLNKNSSYATAKYNIFETSTYDLVYYAGSESSVVTIAANEDATSIRTKIRGMAPWLSTVNVSIFETDSEDGRDYNTGVRVDFPDNLPHRFYITNQRLLTVDQDLNRGFFTLNYNNLAEKSLKISLLYNGLKTSARDDLVITGTFDLYINGKFSTIPVTADSATIVAQLLTDGVIESSSDVSISGGPLSDGEALTITLVGTELGSVYASLAKVSIDGYDYKEDVTNKALGIPTFIKEYTGVAQKYTRQEVAKHIDKSLGDTNLGQAYKKTVQLIAELLELRKKAEENGLTDKQVDDAIQRAQSQLKDIKSRMVYKGIKVSIEDIADNVDEEIYDDMYELETLGFLEYVNQIRDLDVEITDEEVYEFTTLNFGDIVEACPIIIPRWLQITSNTQDKYSRLQRIEALPRSTEPFYINIGDTITDASALQETWVANILPSTVLSVYGFRTISGLKRLVPIPSSWYTKQENDPYGPYGCCTISLVRPLKTFDQSWDEEIYVTYVSSVGPNVCDILEWIATRYTTLTIDNTSFSHVRELLENYPANFALFEKRDALDLMSDIAWQSRCVVWVSRGKLFIRYLPEEPESIDTITEDDIEQNTLSLTFTETEELITKYTALWRPHYAVESPNKLIVRRNIARYSEVNDERDYFIYNNRELTYKSLTFWAIRRANTWRKAVFDVFLNKLPLETNDVITLSLNNTHVSTTPVKAIIESSTYDSDTNRIQLVCWLPIVADETVPFKFVWPAAMDESDFYPDPEDIISGNAGNPINITVPTGEDYDPTNTALLDLRPNDIGLAKITDLGDVVPTNPLAELTELDYKLKDTEEFFLSEDTVTLNDLEDEEVKFTPGKNKRKFTKDIDYGIFLEVLPVKQVTTPEGFTFNLRDIKVLAPNGEEVIAEPFSYNINPTALRRGDKIALIARRAQADDSVFGYYYDVVAGGMAPPSKP